MTVEGSVIAMSTYTQITHHTHICMHITPYPKVHTPVLLFSKTMYRAQNTRNNRIASNKQCPAMSEITFSQYNLSGGEGSSQDFSKPHKN